MVSNRVTFSDRLNYVLFIFKENSTITTLKFRHLLMKYIGLRRNCGQALCPSSWTTYVQFGNENNYTLENGDTGYGIFGQNFYYYINASKVNSLTTTIGQFLLLNKDEDYSEETALTKFYLIISDECYITELYNASLKMSEHPKTYQNFAMLMTQNDSLQCEEIDSLPDNVHFFITTEDPVTETLNASIIYTNMDVLYTAFINSTKINFIALIYKNETNFDFVYNFIKERIISEGSTCRFGNMIGAFEIGNAENKTRKAFTMALPLYFNENETEMYFNYNFYNLFAQASEVDEIKCFENYLMDAQDGPDLNQTIIIYLDSDLPCLNKNRFWNKTYHHLEVIVHMDALYADMSGFIAPNQSQKSNHWSCIDLDDNFTDYISTSTVCRNFVSSHSYNLMSTTLPQTSSSSSITTVTANNNNNNNTSTTTILSTSLIVTSNTPNQKSEKLSFLWIIGGCTVAVIILVISISICICQRKRKKNQKRKQLYHNEIEKKFEDSAIEAKLSSSERQKIFIDKKLLQINLDNILGKGSNAVVYKATFKNKYPQNATLHKNDAIYDVAVKVPSNFVSNDDVEEFVRELDALIMIGSHSNIITFHGWILQQQIPALITELAETDLLQYVRKLRGQELPLKHILSILWQITLALEHIASLLMVHRDVACRNILLTENGTAKLSDFGLCCHCDESFTYRTSLQKRLPLKWLSIEALIDRIFSEKSDVWSFGVLCYEAFSDGSIPYPALSNIEMLEELQNGKRLEKPMKASDEIYDLMKKCWMEQPAERPNFKELSKDLKNILVNETRNYGYLSLDFVKSDNVSL